MLHCKTCHFWKGLLVYNKCKRCYNNTNKIHLTVIDMDQYGYVGEHRADNLYTKATFGCTEHEQRSL